MNGFTAIVAAAERHRLLERATLVYIALPFLIFALGWLRPLVAVPIAAITLAGLYRAQLPVPGRSSRVTTADGRTLAALVLAVLAVGIVMLYSGTGGYAFQFGGHYRNNSFILDLIRHPWPLGFEDVGRQREPGVLAFYIANALSPALVGKLFGWAAAFHFQFLWSALALLLAVCWFMRLVGSWAPQYVLLFLFFGGLDLIGYWVVFGAPPAADVGLDLWVYLHALETPELGGFFWIFPSTLTLLNNSPHHVLCAWLVLLMALDDVVNAGTCRRVGLLVAFALLWSAFSFVGMAPFILLGLWTARGRDMFSFENLVAGVAVLGTTLLYIGSNSGEFLHGPLWQFQDLRETGGLLLLFYAVEFGVYVALLQLVARKGEGLLDPRWRWTAIATLIALPWYRIGDFSDFTTKASVPAILVLQLCVATGLARAGREKRLATVALVAVLLIGWSAALMQVRRAAELGLRIAPPLQTSVKHTNELERRARGAQLFSDGQGFFWGRLADPVEYQTTGKEPPRGAKPGAKKAPQPGAARGPQRPAGGG